MKKKNKEVEIQDCQHCEHLLKCLPFDNDEIIKFECKTIKLLI